MLPNKETITIEFKSDRKGLSDRTLVEEVVAMSNSEGGTIFIGVEDDGTPSGAKKEHLDIDGLRAVIANLTFPSVFVDAQIIEENGFSIIKVEVSPSPFIVSTSSGKTLQRRLRFDGTPEMKPLYPYEFESRRSYLGQIDPSKSSTFPYEESLIDHNALFRAKRFIETNNGADKSLLELSDKEFLSSIDAVFLDEKAKARITLAGLLLFGKNEAIKRLCPNASFAFQRLDGDKVLQNDEDCLNVLEAFDAFVAFISKFNYNDEYIYEMTRRDVPFFDLNALREAFANAIAHRDYAIMDPIRVTYDGTGLTIFNPGTLIRGLCPTGLITAAPRGRNPLLSASLKRLGLCERTGRGVDRIYASFARYGKQWPNYSMTDEYGVTVFLPRSPIDATFAGFIATRKPNINPLPLISLSYIRRVKKANLNQISASTSIEIERIKADLEELQKEGIIKKDGELYSLSGISNDITNVKISGEEAILQILSLAKSHSEGITSNDVQSFLGIGGDKAHYLLKKALEKNILRIEGKLKYTRYYPVNK